MKRFYVFLLFVISLTYQTNFNLQANENNLIGTLSILKPKFYPISPLHGAVAWQQEWVMKLYDLGWDRDKSTGKLIIDDEQPPALIKIIDRLFHRPPGTSGMMNFSPAKDIRDQASGDVAQTLGKIIALLPEMSSKDVGSKEAGSKFNRLKELAEQLKAGAKIEKIKAAASSLCEVSDAEFFEKLAESKKALQNVKIPEKAISAIEFKKLINEFCEFKESCGKLVRGADTPQLLRQAFSQNPQETLLTLLALLWACCESSRDDLANYYQALDEKTREVRNTSIFSKDQAPGWDKWIADKFDPKLKDQMIADLQVFDGKIEENPQLYEALTYLVMMPGKYPKLSGYKTQATLWFNGKQHSNVTFANCMDTSMMNFLLVLAYNKDTTEFNAEFLKQKLELQTINEKLEQFLNSGQPEFIRKIKDKEDSKIRLTPQTVEEIEIHNAWTDVESNIPGVAYNECLKGETIEMCKHGSKGFIVATPELKNASGLQEAGYVIVSPGEGICFELQPSLKNFIVLFNYLLNLELFDPAKVYVEILKPYFIKTYLPMLAEKLKIKIEPSVSLDEIDIKDYRDQILTQLGFENEFPFELSTSHGHGEIIKKYSIFAKELKNTFDMLPMASNSLSSLRGIKLGNMESNDIKAGKFVSNGVYNFYDLPWLDISSTLAITNILDGIAISKAQASDEIVGYFMHLAEEGPDIWTRVNIYNRIFYSFEQLSDKYVDKMLTFASNNLVDPDADIRRQMLYVIMALVKKGKGYAKAIVAASNCLIDRHGDVRGLAHHLFEVLFEKGQGYSEAITLASNCLDNADKNIRAAALDLFKPLIQMGQGYAEAIVAASKGILDVENFVQTCALDLFRVLFAKGHGYPEALAAASKGVADADVSVRWISIQLFGELVKNGHGYTEAIASASKLIGDEDAHVRWGAIQVFKELIKHDQGYPEAIVAASQSAMDTDYNVQISAIGLFAELVKKGQGYAEAMSAASECVQDAEYDVRGSAIYLFQTLVENGQGYDQAIAVLPVGMGDASPNVRYSASHLLNALIEKGRITERNMAEIIKRMQNKVEARRFFDSNKENFKDAKIKADLEQYVGQQ